jgi:4-amino-4-deoxy-L-arabinose transferase-like glycosyltransferase
MNRFLIGSMLSRLCKKEVLGVPALFFLALAILYFITRLPILGFLPFVQDEAIYTIMIGGQQDSLTLIPTLFGYPISWKMAPFFWLYSALAPLASGTGLEAGFRFPSMVFGFLCIVPLFLILRHFSDDARAFVSSIFYLVCFVSVYPNTSLLIDSPAFLLILLSLYYYVVKGNPLVGGAFTAIAFTFKLVTAFISPLLAIGYFILIGKREALTSRMFLASLALPVLAALANYALLSPFGGGNQVYFEELLPRLLSSGVQMDSFTRILMSLNTLAYAMGPVFLLSLSDSQKIGARTSSCLSGTR